MVAIRAAFDASKDDPGGITVVAGYIGDADEWRQVEEKWKLRLALRKLRTFHLVEVMNELGAKAGLECADEFANIISASNLRAVTACMRDTDWALLDKDSAYRQIYPERQHACLGMLLSVLAEEAQLEFKGEPIAVVFDNDYGNVAKAAVVYEAWRERTGHAGFPTIAFMKDQLEWDVVPLQCADLLAWLLRRDPFSAEMLKAEAERSTSWPTSPTLTFHKVFTSGRGAMWSLALAREVEETLRKRRESV